MFGFIKYIWQLPQNIIGFWLTRGSTKETFIVDGEEVVVNFTNRSPGGISLGNYIVLKDYYNRMPDDILEPIVRHEHGHQIQSLIWGPLYLFVIGIPSILCNKFNRLNYYQGFPENQADKFGHVNRYMATLKLFEYKNSMKSYLQKDRNLLYYEHNKKE